MLNNYKLQRNECTKNKTKYTNLSWKQDNETFWKITLLVMQLTLYSSATNSQH